jgi:hypothetical protein
MKILNKMDELGGKREVPYVLKKEGRGDLFVVVNFLVNFKEGGSIK